MSRPNSSHTGKRRKNRSRTRKVATPRLSDEKLERLEQILEHEFENKELLFRAVTHSSAVPGDAARLSNERLEFLGDRVLGLVIADELIKRFETEREGGLAKRLNALVCREKCAELADKIGIGEYVILDEAERQRGGAERMSTLANAMEAIIGALYLDAGLDIAARFIGTHWKATFKTLTEAPKDPKSELQEELQGEGRPAPIYRQTSREGPDHAPRFKVEVIVEGEEPAEGEGASKQAAERAAASAMLVMLGVQS